MSDDDILETAKRIFNTEDPTPEQLKAARTATFGLRMATASHPSLKEPEAQKRLRDEIDFSWSARETTGLGMPNVQPCARLDVTNERWAAIREKAAAEGMDPTEWFEREIERANNTLETS